MSFNDSFGNGEIEEEINLEDLAKMKENENTIDNMVNSVDTVPKNNDIFNSVFTTEIDNHDELKKLEFFQTQLIQEKINYNIVNLFKIINNRINSYKISFFYKLKYILNQKYSKLVTAEILYMDMKTKMDHFLFFFRFLILTKLQKSFNKIKNYTYLKKHQKEQEQIIKRKKKIKYNH